MQVTEKKVRGILSEVLDPELNISIVDLGLIYAVKIDKKKNVVIRMTLTTIGCPLFSLIENEIRSKLDKYGVRDEHVKLELTFEPPWSIDKMSEKAKAMLGM